VTERAEKMAKLAEKKNLEPQVEPEEPAPQCMNPTQIQHGRDRAEFLDVFNPVVLRTLIKVTDMPSHAAIKKWLRHDTWDCQKPCLRYVFDRSVETMWGTGQLFGDDNKTLLTQALTGAFKACYPRSFRPHVLALISQVVDVDSGTAIFKTGSLKVSILSSSGVEPLSHDHAQTPSLVTLFP